MTRKKSISERRRLTGSFTAIPDLMYKSDAFKSLQSPSRDILMFVISQYNGDNNGGLTCTFEKGVVGRWGMSIGKRYFQKCLKELIEKGFLIKTVQGGRHKPSRFAVTIYAIDEGGDTAKPTGSAPAMFLGWKEVDEN